MADGCHVDELRFRRLYAIICTLQARRQELINFRKVLYELTGHDMHFEETLEATHFSFTPQQELGLITPLRESTPRRSILKTRIQNFEKLQN